VVDIEGERLVFLDIVQHTFTDGGPGGGHLIPRRLLYLNEVADASLDFDGLILGTAIGMVHAQRDDTITKFGEVFDQMSEIEYLIPYERYKRGVDTDQVVLALPKYRYSLIQFFLPALGRVCEYSFRVRTMHEAMVTVLALKRWRLEKGQFPMSLSELVMGDYLTQVPLDPYSDKALVYKKTGDDFTLYSLGQNFTDDGGRLIREGDEIEKWGTEDEGDAVFWPVPKSQAKKKDIYEKHEQTETHRKTIL